MLCHVMPMSKPFSAQGYDLPAVCLRLHLAQLSFMTAAQV